LKTGDGRALPDHLKAQISRELARLELLLEQIKAMEAERDALFAAAKATMPASGPVAMLLEIKGIGPDSPLSFGWRRSFAASPIENRSQPTLAWRRRPGKADRSIANRVFRKPAIRDCDNAHPARLAMAAPSAAIGVGSVVQERVSRNGARFKKTTIVALARKLLVALWKYVTARRHH